MKQLLGIDWTYGKKTVVAVSKNGVTFEESGKIFTVPLKTVEDLLTQST